MTRPIVTGLGKAYEDRVLVRGKDLTDELLGNITFTDMLSFILLGKMPTPDERRMLDAMLVVLVEHGLISGVIAARFAYGTAPESLQACVATALLGAGSKHLGTSDLAAQVLQEAVQPGADEAAIDAAARAIDADFYARKAYLPGIGHRTHAGADPRARKLFELAHETGTYGTYCALIERLTTVAEERRNRKLGVNVTGAIGAIASDMGFRWQMAKSFALIGRTLGALGHLNEEMENPIADDIRAAIMAQVQYQPNGVEAKA